MLTNTSSIFSFRETEPDYADAHLTRLPFIGNPDIPGGNWHVPPANNFFTACDAGGAYAAHFAQFLKDNPLLAGHGTLGHIAADIPFAGCSPDGGYWAGFFAYLELLILDGVAERPIFADWQAYRTGRPSSYERRAS